MRTQVSIFEDLLRLWLLVQSALRTPTPSEQLEHLYLGCLFSLEHVAHQHHNSLKHSSCSPLVFAVFYLNTQTHTRIHVCYSESLSCSVRPPVLILELKLLKATAQTHLDDVTTRFKKEKMVERSAELTCTIIKTKMMTVFSVIFKLYETWSGCAVFRSQTVY